ncbi:hypothetical protein [Paenibacillus sp. IHB B 3415]|uniref:hypothetical protein n=1 Tax=Paenibacillus sp. IHB B 3415 TaxID=867080 RepID=UPI00128DEB3C|nr:hypothetical protein [Paenibacillus sp. IHB B 3415]
MLGKSKTLFDEFNVIPGKGLNLDIPFALNGRSYITYAFKNLGDEIEYVGRASGKGTPNDVMKQRIAKGHDHFHAGINTRNYRCTKEQISKSRS